MTGFYPGMSFPERIVVGLLSLFLSGFMEAAEVDGYNLPDNLDVAEGPLLLNGCGLRELAWSDLYLVGLYLPQVDMERVSILGDDTPKAIRLEIVYDDTLPDNLPASWREPLREQVSQELFGLLQELYDRVGAGDILVFHYDPDLGTTVLLNDAIVTEAADAALINALLQRWIGEDPVSSNLRRLLLSGQC